MPGFRLTARAEVDFDEIGAYTKARWGLRQAAAYQAELDAAFHRLAAEHGLGRSRSDIRNGLQSWPSEKHVIFFRRAASGDITILRILHQSQDFDRHL